MARKRCRFCQFKSDDSVTVCPVCGIEKGKSKSDLTKQERKVKNAGLNIRIIGLLSIGGGLLFLFLIIMWLAGEKKLLGLSTLSFSFLRLISFSWASLLHNTGVGLST